MDYSANPHVAVIPELDGRCRPCPDLLTEPELIAYLRIAEISKATNFRNAINNLKRFHDLPRIHICGQPLYPREAIQEWIRHKTAKEGK